MTWLFIAIGLWLVLVFISSMILYTVAQRDLLEARRLREEVRQLTETPPPWETITQALIEKEGAALQ